MGTRGSVPQDGLWTSVLVSCQSTSILHVFQSFSGLFVDPHIRLRMGS
jgi:hypothetical protein